VKLCPAVVEQIVQPGVVRLPDLGAVSNWAASPLEDVAPPLAFVPPTDAVLAIPVGLTGEPPVVTGLGATSVEPTFRLAGESVTAPARTEAVPALPAPERASPPPEARLHDLEARGRVLLSTFGSGSPWTDAVTSSAPGCSAATSQIRPTPTGPTAFSTAPACRWQALRAHAPRSGATQVVVAWLGLGRPEAGGGRSRRVV